jgi:hypothetical protein
MRGAARPATPSVPRPSLRRMRHDDSQPALPASCALSRGSTRPPPVLPTGQEKVTFEDKGIAHPLNGHRGAGRTCQGHGTEVAVSTMDSRCECAFRDRGMPRTDPVRAFRNRGMPRTDPVRAFRDRGMPRTDPVRAFRDRGMPRTDPVRAFRDRGMPRTDPVRAFRDRGMPRTDPVRAFRDRGMPPTHRGCGRLQDASYPTLLQSRHQQVMLVRGTTVGCCASPRTSPCRSRRNPHAQSDMDWAELSGIIVFTRCSPTACVGDKAPIAAR